MEKDKDGFYVVECPVLESCYTQGKNNWWSFEEYSRSNWDDFRRKGSTRNFEILSSFKNKPALNYYLILWSYPSFRKRKKF